MLRVDALSTLLRTIVLAGGALSVLIAADYLRRTRLESGEYYALLLIGTAGASLLTSAVHLLMILLAMETVARSLCVLACFDRENPRCQEAELKYLLLMGTPMSTRERRLPRWRWRRRRCPGLRRLWGRQACSSWASSRAGC